MSVFVLIVLPIATLLVAGCVGAVQIYLELMKRLSGLSERPRRAQAVQRQE